MNPVKESLSVLAVRPTSRGCAFVVMTSPIHQPDVLALEDLGSNGSHRAPRIKRLLRAISALGTDRAIEVHAYSRSSVRACFERFGARTRHEIAVTLAQRIPAFEFYLPPPRKIWMNEDPRLSIFDALSLALTFFLTETGVEDAGP
jgi:hypothetical protein